ncbi:MAG: NUDIX domain-containing protein, partial [Planctomycetota bacterium]
MLKIDSFSQMRRELDGYYQVKDFFGKHVPTFDFPVVLGDSIGVGMELAAMDGHPETLQDTFEQTDQEEALNCFLGRLDKALALLSERLYRNTCRTTPVVPYRAFWLHTDQQLQWLRENAGFAMSYHQEAQPAENTGVNPIQIEKMLRVVAANEDTLESEVCLSHGDLNLANIICDQGDNTWFIDWTHCGENPVELDFAKLENDIKFAVNKEFEVDDLPRLKKFEDYLLAHRLPADANSLPEDLKFAKWDLRFRKVLAAIRRVREACFSLKQDDDWLIYRTALLKYALHTLSFDKRRGRGECDLPQLMLALYSIEGLVFDLIADDFHLKIRAERPSVYPPRQRIAIDEAPWLFECPDYDPPYYVAPEVLENDRTRTAGGWAEPEDFAKTTPPEHDAKHKDDQGRPLNPRGRTGIAGRGLLGRWGPNLAVAAIVTRAGAEAGQLEILLGRKEGRSILAVPKGFVQPDETPETAVHRVLREDVGWAPAANQSGETVFDGYSYDPRQTDHAWVEMRACLLHQEQDAESIVPRPGGDFEEAAWHPL